MSSYGAPDKGDQPSFSIDTSLGTQIERYHLIQVSENTTTSNVILAGLCGTGATARDTAIGVAFRAWPYVPQVYTTDAKPATDISNVDTNRKKKFAVKQEGYTYIKVEIPSGGNTVTISPGNWLVPSTQTPGSVEPLPAATLTGTYASATIIADQKENRIIVGRAYSPIIIPASGSSWGAMPALYGGTRTLTLTALTNAVTYGYIFAKLGK